MEDNENEDQPIGRREAEAQLVERAWKDEAFRNLLLSDPKKAIQAEFGTEIPAEIEIVVNADTESIKHIVLPQEPKTNDGQELSGDELEAVAGGGGTVEEETQAAGDRYNASFNNLFADLEKRFEGVSFAPNFGKPEITTDQDGQA